MGSAVASQVTSGCGHDEWRGTALAELGRHDVIDGEAADVGKACLAGGSAFERRRACVARQWLRGEKSQPSNELRQDADVRLRRQIRRRGSARGPRGRQRVARRAAIGGREKGEAERFGSCRCAFGSNVIMCPHQAMRSEGMRSQRPSVRTAERTPSRMRRAPWNSAAQSLTSLRCTAPTSSTRAVAISTGSREVIALSCAVGTNA